MDYKVHHEVKDGRLVRLYLGIPEVDAYLDFFKHRSRANTWINYAHDLQIFVNVIGKPLALIKPRDIFSFIQQQRETPSHRGRGGELVPLSPGLSPRTVKRRLATISGFYNYLMVLGDSPVKANPVPHGLVTRGAFPGSLMRDGTGGRATPLVRVPHTLPQPLEVETIKRFLGSLHTHRDRAMLLLMLLGGLRKSEVIGLNLGDLDFGQCTVLIREGKADISGSHRSPPCSRHRRRHRLKRRRTGPAMS